MDFNARQYDPQLGRFLGVDPLAASQGQEMFSPYAAMGNAPESMVDPNGTLPTYSSDGTRNDMLSTYAKDYVAEVGERGTGNFGNGNGGWSDRIWGGGMSRVMANAAEVAEKAKNDAEKTTGESKTQGGGNTISNLSSGNSTNSVEQENGNGNNNKKEQSSDYAIILHDKDGANGAGHTALLIGNSDDKYLYMSKDGGASGISGEEKYTVQKYNTFKEFLNSVERERYKEFLIIPVAHQKVANIVKVMNQEINKPYNVVTSNCIGAVLTAMYKNNIKGFNPRLVLFMTPNQIFNSIKNSFYNFNYGKRK